MQPDEDALNRWRLSAPFREKHRETIRRMFAPVTQALIEDAAIAAGHTVLDIATGPGEPALTIADVVGPQGEVFGVDPAPEMVASARRAADQLSVGNAGFEIAFADRLPFADTTFDAIVSRFGIMFFPSPVEAVREMLRVLKPGRKLALAVWHFAENNPFLHAPSRVLNQYTDQYIDSPIPEPDAPDTYRFAQPKKLRDVLVKAGAIATAERLLQFRIQVPLSPDDAWTVRREISETLREKMASLSEEQLAAAKRRILEDFNRYSTESGMSFPAEVLILSGSKSAATTD